MFKKKIKEYKITKEVKYLWTKHNAFYSLRERYIELDNTKLAKESAIESARLRTKFWGMVIELYPELSKKELEYHTHENFVTIKEWYYDSRTTKTIESIS